MKPNKAFVLAAGLGTRMRPLTDQMPKPMVRLQGRTLIDHTLDRLESAGVTDVTINLHHKGDVLRSHLASRKSPALHFSEEPELLDTGGGIKNSLQHFGDEAFYVLSGDSYWEETGEPALDALAAAWKPEKMDILIMLQPVKTMCRGPRRPFPRPQRPIHVHQHPHQLAFHFCSKTGGPVFLIFRPARRRAKTRKTLWNRA
jgi:MurNAc alpha-1-phosphate uridylyltransferase